MADVSLAAFALVTAGGALGGVARYLLALRLSSSEAPWGTVAANVTGSFLLTLAVALPGVSEAGVLFLAMGFCGGLTTMSTLAAESAHLLSGGAWRRAVAHLAANVGGAVAAAAAGLLLAGAFA